MQRIGFKSSADKVHLYLLIFFGAFAARAVLLLLVAISHVDVFRWSLDSWEYLATMQALQSGNLNFYMFIYRTPAYPFLLSVFAGLFNLQSPQMGLWLPFQAVITSIGVVFASRIIQRLFGNRTFTLYSGLLLAVFPANLAAETPILTEAMFNFTLIISLWLLLRWLGNRRWRDLALCLLALDILMLIRPTGEYFIVIVIAVVAAYNWRLLRYVPVMLVAIAIPIFLWTAHNIAAYGINTFSSAGMYSFLFYKAVSTETMVTGQSPTDIAWAYSRTIENEIGNPPRADSKTFPVGNFDYLYVTNPARFAAMSQLASEKLRQYNVLHLVKMPYVILRQFFEYDTLMPFTSVAERIAIGLLTLGLFFVGLWSWLRQRHPIWHYILILGTIAYFLASLAVYAAYYNGRYVSPIGLFLVPFIVLGAQRVMAWGTMRFKQTRRPIAA